MDERVQAALAEYELDRWLTAPEAAEYLGLAVSPELARIVTELGLNDLIDTTITSAEIGYEKPHPEAFAAARRAAGEAEKIWMVGDNPRADIEGAERVRIPAIHVRRGEDRDPVTRRWVHTLLDIEEIVSV